MKAMRFKSAKLDEVMHFIESDEWVAEQKLDGTRTQVRVTGNGVELLACNGTPLKHTAATQHQHHIAAALRPVVDSITRSSLPYGSLVLDGELITSTGEFWVFDLPESLQPFEQRRTILERMHRDLLSESQYIRLIPQAKTVAEKNRLAEALVRQRAEGLMVKRRDGLYVPGGRVTTGLKMKFVKTADVICTARDLGGKKNARMAVYKDGELKSCGSVTMIGKHDIQQGEVFEVKYLFLGDGGHLYQPRFMRPRPDKLPIECDWDQLVPTSREVLTL